MEKDNINASFEFDDDKKKEFKKYEQFQKKTTIITVQIQMLSSCGYIS